VPSATAGEAVWAYVELYPGHFLPASEVLRLCREQLAPFQVPEQVRFLERLPTTATGKVEKYRLRELARAESQGQGGRP
jgi:fatty-acyl-CoA synthase